MATVNIKSNPVVAKVGSLDSDATEIQSALSGVRHSIVFYQIQNLDVRGETISADSNTNYAGFGNVISCTPLVLKIILKGRTRYRARVRAEGYGAPVWGSWAYFKTRDKRYQSPDSITQLTDDTNATATQQGSRTINVTNNAKATVVIDLELGKGHTGARVKNTDKLYNDTTSITTSENGVLVVNDGTIKFTDRGATIDNR